MGIYVFNPLFSLDIIRDMERSQSDFISPDLRFPNGFDFCRVTEYEGIVRNILGHHTSRAH